MKFQINEKICTFCGGCASVCPVMAVDVKDSSCAINNKCIGCSLCENFCPVSAVENGNEK